MKTLKAKTILGLTISVVFASLAMAEERSEAPKKETTVSVEFIQTEPIPGDGEVCQRIAIEDKAMKMFQCYPMSHISYSEEREGQTASTGYAFKCLN